MSHYFARIMFVTFAFLLFAVPTTAQAETIYDVPNPVPMTVFQSIHFSCDGTGDITVDQVGGLGSVTEFTYQTAKTEPKSTVAHWSNVLGSLLDRTFSIGMLNPSVTAHLETISSGMELTEKRSLGNCAGGGGVYNPVATVSPASSRLRIHVLGCGSAVAFQSMLGGTFPDGIKLVLTMNEGDNETERSIPLVGEGATRWSHGQFVSVGSGNPATVYNFPNNDPVVTDRCRRL